MTTIVQNNEAAVEADFSVSPEALAVLDELKARAVVRAGFDDFGPDDYEKPLALILEEGLAKPGREDWKAELETALVARLIREAEWQRNPAYKDREISAPLIVCGRPRTGTTALHKLLSVDPQFQGIDHWLSAWPKPRPPRDQWDKEPGFLYAVAILQKRFADTPGMKVSHDVVADELDECLEILRHDFVSNRYPSMTYLPRYDRWYQQQDETPYYQRLADTLRLIGLHDDRRWLLKNPGHFGHLDSVFAVFPDARVIITDRDPVKSFTSLCSVLQHAQRFFDPQADLEQMARRELAYWSEARERTEAIKQTEYGHQILDVEHKDFHADPIGTVRAIYAHCGLTLLPGVEAEMRDWLARNPADKHGEHKYSLENYGLTQADIHQALGEG